jgi:hypothetical protein
MKKLLLLLLLTASSLCVVFSQNPCPVDYKINNGGGQCPDLNGTSATGTITLSFDGPIDPLNIPSIGSVYDVTDPANPQLVTGITFGPGILHVNGDVEYCYYVGPNNNNNLLGANSQFRFVVSYNGLPCGEQGALPVTFRDFTASRNNSVVALNWITSTENNNLGFEIQRLIGNGNWEVLSFTATQAIRGNSSSDINYTYADQNPTKGISQYRIKQIDIDRRSKLSEIRAVRGDGQNGKTIVYPNPSIDGKVNVLFEDKDASRDISLMDMNGRVIKQWKAVFGNTLKIDNLVTGFYTIRIINPQTGEQVVEKIIVKSR